MNAEFNRMRTDLANSFASAGAALLDYMTIDGTKTAALAAIPETDPQQYAIAGTLAGIAQMLPKAAPGVEAMVAQSGVLTGEQILSALESITHEVPKRLPPGWLKFARAIERATITRLAATTQASTAQAEPGSAPCRNCIGFGWEPSVNGERRPCAFCATSSTEAQAAAEVRDAALEEAITACRSERVDAEETKTPGDVAYNTAISHCIQAIRALRAGDTGEQADGGAA